jgi:hypothetical protein
MGSGVILLQLLQLLALESVIASQETLFGASLSLQ